MPEVTSVGPVYVLAPVSVRVLVALLVTLMPPADPLSEITPLMEIAAPPVTVKLRVLFKARGRLMS